jgi:hypothetical protein
VLWLHVLWPPASGAVVQKVLILMIVAALSASAARLWLRGSRKLPQSAALDASP